MKNIWRILFCLLVILAGYNSAQTASYYSLSDEQIYEINYIWEIKNYGGPATNYKLSVPMVDMNEQPPYQQLISFQAKPSRLKPVIRKGTADYVIPKIDSGQTITIEHQYTFRNYAIEHELHTFYGTTMIESKYLHEEEGIESNSEIISNLAREITDGEHHPLEKSKKIYEYVNSTLKYELEKDSPKSALEAIRRGSASCEGFSLLYIALCRSVGIPARFVFGYRFKPEEISSNQTSLESLGHAWTEVNLPGLGWITVDPTYNYLLNGVKKTSYDFYGRIMPKDRHLFINYTREPSTHSTWSYNPRNPAKFDVKTTTYIRRVR